MAEDFPTLPPFDAFGARRSGDWPDIWSLLSDAERDGYVAQLRNYLQEQTGDAFAALCALRFRWHVCHFRGDSDPTALP